VQLFLPQIPHGLAWDLTQTTVETDFQYRRINTVMNAFGNICNTLPLHNIITIQKLCLLPPFFVTVIWDKVPQLHWCYYFTTKDNYLSSSAVPHESLAVEDGYRSHPHVTLAITGLPFQRQQQQQRQEQGDEFSRQVKKRDNVVA